MKEIIRIDMPIELYRDPGFNVQAFLTEEARRCVDAREGEPAAVQLLSKQCHAVDMGWHVPPAISMRFVIQINRQNEGAEDENSD